MPLSHPPSTANLQLKAAPINFNQSAGTYDAFEASGDVWVEVEQVYVKTAAGGLNTASIQTSHGNGSKSIVASTARAALAADAVLEVVTQKFVLPSGKKIQYTITGTGNAGAGYLVVNWAPISPGAFLD